MGQREDGRDGGRTVECACGSDCLNVGGGGAEGTSPSFYGQVEMHRFVSLPSGVESGPLLCSFR